jgi:hypothetical protein
MRRIMCARFRIFETNASDRMLSYGLSSASLKVCLPRFVAMKVLDKTRRHSNDKVKVKLSRYKPGQALAVPGG